MKTVLITGATSGFGRATAELLLSKNYRLILLGRREEKLKELEGENVFTYVLDVRDRNAIDKFSKTLPKEFKEIDILINNAGLALGLSDAVVSDLDDWEKMVDTNIKGVLHFTKFVLPAMKERNSGMIINIGSVAGHAPYKGGNVYGATKAFVKQFSRNLRADLYGTDIKITNIEPGMAETEFSDVRFKGDHEKAKEVYAGMRPLTADDIAETILWIIERPLHVNIDNIEIMPLDQTWGGLTVNRK